MSDTIEVVPGSEVHSHSIEEMSAGVFRPGLDCEECRARDAWVRCERPGYSVRITGIDHDAKTITIGPAET